MAAGNTISREAINFAPKLTPRRADEGRRRFWINATTMRTTTTITTTTGTESKMSILNCWRPQPGKWHC